MRAALFAALAVALAAPNARPADATPTADERAAMDAVVRLGGKATVDPKLAPEARVAATFDGPTDSTFFALRKVAQVGAVGVFDATRVSDKGFAVLKELPHLRKLTVERAGLSPAAVAAVGQCKELRHLALVGCGVGDASLAGLKDLTRLEHLALPDNPLVTDKGLATVKGFDRLRVLNLNKTGVTDKGLPELRGLDGLRSLSVRGARVSGDAADKFPDGMPNLRKVAW